MSIHNLQNNKHYCQETIYNYQMPLFDAVKFAEWLTDAFNQSSFKSQTQLGEKVGVTRATISNLMGAKPQSLTGKPSQPNSDLVERLATALEKNIDEALILAGHAPRNSSEMPKLIFDAIGQSGFLTDSDFEMTANFIRTLNEQRKKEQNK